MLLHMDVDCSSCFDLYYTFHHHIKYVCIIKPLLQQWLLSKYRMTWWNGSWHIMSVSLQHVSQKIFKWPFYKLFDSEATRRSEFQIFVNLSLFLQSDRWPLATLHHLASVPVLIQSRDLESEAGWNIIFTQMQLWGALTHCHWLVKPHPSH